MINRWSREKPTAPGTYLMRDVRWSTKTFKMLVEWRYGQLYVGVEGDPEDTYLRLRTVNTYEWKEVGDE